MVMHIKTKEEQLLCGNKGAVCDTINETFYMGLLGLYLGGFHMTWIIIILAVAALLAAGMVWQHISAKRERGFFLFTGKMMDVPGAKMHVLSQGKGVPVVLLSGWDTAVPSVDFQPLVKELNGKGFHTIIVEKPGYGFSSWTKAPRDIDTVVDEMHLALEKAGEKGPFILCGHSMAGTEMLRWACRYPDEVRALYTLDAPAPLCYTTLPVPPAFMTTLQGFMRVIGLRRLLMMLPNYRKSYWKYLNDYHYLDPALLPLEKAMQINNCGCPTMKEEMVRLPDNSRIAGDVLPEGIPLTMFIASETKERFWDKMQPLEDEYIAKNNGTVIDLPGRHNLQHYAPDKIAQRICDDWKDVQP